VCRWADFLDLFIFCGSVSERNSCVLELFNGALSMCKSGSVFGGGR
jgi:hypothetical protein